MRRAVLAATACLLISCSHLGSNTAKTEYIRQDYRGRIGKVRIVLKEVSVRAGAGSDRVRENAEHILRIILEQRGQAEEYPERTLSARVRLKEESFFRDYRTFNSVTAEVTLHETEPADPGAGGIAARSLYSENTEETLVSYAYLHEILLKAFGRFK
jgi:hypothetical protein